MARVRRIVAPVAALWLLVQSAALVVVPAFFIASAEASPIECTCLHGGNHHDCPMHHGSPMGARICSQATDSIGFAALGSMLGHVGLVPSSFDSLQPTPPPLAALLDISGLALRPAAPEPPPPRA